MARLRKMSSSTYLPLRFVFLFSLSLASSFTKARLNLGNIDALSPPSKPKATASDLLSLLGTPHQYHSVNSQVAEDIWSCFKFIVPFPPYYQTLESRRSLSSKISFSSHRSGKDIDDLILSPPEPVLELARLAVDSGADPGAIQRSLDPTIIPVPDIEGSNEERCELTRTPYGRRFINEELNSYLEFLFKVIAERGPSVGLNVSLSRYDFFHGHLFLAADSGRIGILFHAKEYPAYDKEVFPLNMGYCQVGVLVILDAHPEGIIYRDLIPDYVQIARTLYEDDFGEVVVDVNYLNVGTEVPKFQVFLC